MLALLFTFSLFLYWGLIGFATLTLFPPRLRLLQSTLIAPALGVAVVVLPVFFLNRLGLPVQSFGRILIVVLGLLASGVLIIKRPLFPFRRLVPYFGVLLAALFLVAWPMALYGFDWLSFCNDDMANYCLAAQRFLQHGFFDIPNLDEFSEGRNYSLAYWFMHVAGGVRSGSELMLSVIWALSGLNAHQIFMPVIIALHLSLIGSAASLVSGFSHHKKAPFIAAGLMAISPLTALGTLYQLIGQVGGLALLCGAITLLYRPQSTKPISKLLVRNIPAALMSASLFVWYPEALPFLGLGWLLYLALVFRRSRELAKRILIPALVVCAILLIGLNQYVITALQFMLGQASGGMGGAQDLSSLLFPFYLIPSGIPTLWGLVPIAGNVKEPFLSLAIGVGILLSFWLLKVLKKQLMVPSLPAVMSACMLSLSVLLFFRNNDFGLYKLAMYLQPFLLGVVAISLSKRSWKISPSQSALVGGVLFVCLLVSQQSYIAKSTGELGGGLVEIPHASSQKINQQFTNTLKEGTQDRLDCLLLDTNNVVLAKFQALYTQGRTAVFICKDFMIKILETPPIGKGGLLTKNIWAEKSAGYNRKNVWLDGRLNSFEAPANTRAALQDYMLLSASGRNDIIGRYYKTGEGSYFSKEKKPKNHLYFVHSQMGQSYYFATEKKRVSFFPLEKDPLFIGKEFSSLGRYFLFMVQGATPNPRLLLELTSTVLKPNGSQLPHPNVQSATVGFVGRGSGRVISSPLSLTVIDGVPYLTVDMGLPFRLPTKLSGLMNLYGRHIPADPRLITAFGRDISLLSEEEYQSFQAPESLENFPSDLGNKHLEYSGIYEDGWISEEAFFILAPKPTAQYLVVKGMIPQVGIQVDWAATFKGILMGHFHKVYQARISPFQTTITLQYAGEVVAQKNLSYGHFEIKVPFTTAMRKKIDRSRPGRQRIDLKFDRYQILPGEDERIIGAKINFIGFSIS